MDKTTQIIIIYLIASIITAVIAGRFAAYGNANAAIKGQQHD